MAAVSSWPITSPIRSNRTVWGQSTITCDGSLNPVGDPAGRLIRRSGTSVRSSVVTGRTVAYGRLASRSDRITMAGRGLSPGILTSTTAPRRIAPRSIAILPSRRRSVQTHRRWPFLRWSGRTGGDTAQPHVPEPRDPVRREAIRRPAAGRAHAVPRDAGWRGGQGEGRPCDTPIAPLRLVQSHDPARLLGRPITCITPHARHQPHTSPAARKSSVRQPVGGAA